MIVLGQVSSLNSTFFVLVGDRMPKGLIMGVRDIVVPKDTLIGNCNVNTQFQNNTSCDGQTEGMPEICNYVCLILSAYANPRRLLTYLLFLSMKI